MKKATILTISLVLAAAISAMWFARDRNVTSHQANSPLADAQVPPLPIAADSVIETDPAQTAVLSNAARSDPSEETDRTFGEAVPLILEPTTRGVDYLDATSQVSLKAAHIDNLIRSRIVEVDVRQVRAFIDAAINSPEQIDGMFTLPLFPGVTCTLISIERSRRIESDTWGAAAKCDEIETANVTATFDFSSEESTFLVNVLPTLESEPRIAYPGATYTVSSLQGSRFSHVFERDTDPQARGFVILENEDNPP